MTFKDTPANRKKYEQCIAHYRANVEALSESELFAIVKRAESLRTRSAIVKQAIQDLAHDELVKRGYQLPLLSALFSLA